MIDLDRHLPEIVAGDPDAFARWVAGAEHALRESLRSFAAQVDVEAVVQETLLRVWNSAPRVSADGKPNCLFRWAVTAARHLALSEIRRRRDRSDPAELGSVTEPSEPDPLLRGLIWLCVKLLPPQPRAAMFARMSADGGSDDASLAGQLRMKLNTFLQNVTRARRLIAQCLASRGVNLEAPP